MVPSALEFKEFEESLVFKKGFKANGGASRTRPAAGRWPDGWSPVSHREKAPRCGKAGSRGYALTASLTVAPSIEMGVYDRD